LLSHKLINFENRPLRTARAAAGSRSRILGSSGLSDRVPLNCGCTLAVTTNPKVQW